MNNIEKRLKELNIELPEAKAGVGAYKSWALFSENIVCTSGQLPWNGDVLAFQGTLGIDVDIKTGYESARLCAIHAIAQLKEATNGDLSKVKQIIRVEGNIQTAPNFYDHADVLNGASELFNEVFGDKGVHTRTAQGMSSSPLNSPTLIYIFAEIEK
ncbi:RidA family protein [Arcobacter roscoffensis]|uniref:RidA family protein n=1 Tax=Arcobacter roscoffensis TaxID=2961520 RepID=A0ABY5E5A8_9BACT|nr:RidA family protein [Arcobacter roscoffensis]UTJ07042.1 RidA family protein [Arcobacter roscoffensis]